MSETFSKENLAQHLTYTTAHLNPEVMHFLRDFVNEEAEKNEQFPDDDDRQDFLWNFSMSADQVFSTVEQHCDLNMSFVVVAEGPKGTVGFSIVGIDKSGRVINAFVGVEYQSLKKGIATELIRRRHDKLREMGYTEYHVSVWEASRKAIEKAVGHPIEPISNDPKEKEFIVRL